jgi:hypothetical protein
MAREFEPQQPENVYLEKVLNLQQVDVSTYTEIDIRAPAKVIWGYVTDERQARFSPATYRLETGAYGEIGSVLEVHSTIGGTQRSFPRMRQKIIDSIPYRYFVYRMSSQITKDAIETLTGYDVFIFQEFNEVTKLMFIQPLAFGNLNITSEELPAFREGQRRFIRPIFEDLKRLVESEYRSS